MIQIKKSPTADTRTCNAATVTREELLESSRIHIRDVVRAMSFFSGKLTEAAGEHDYDKIAAIDWFHADFVTNFKQTGWWDNHRKIHRHHLAQEDGVPPDVNLLDVLEYIADCVMAGMARAGSVTPLVMPPELLQRAFLNTVELLKGQVEVIGEPPVSAVIREPLYVLEKRHEPGTYLEWWGDGEGGPYWTDNIDKAELYTAERAMNERTMLREEVWPVLAPAKAAAPAQAGPVSPSDSPVSAVMAAAEALAGMNEPSVETILRKRGFGHEADGVKSLTDAVAAAKTAEKDGSAPAAPLYVALKVICQKPHIIAATADENTALLAAARTFCRELLQVESASLLDDCVTELRKNSRLLEGDCEVWMLEARPTGENPTTASDGISAGS